MEQTDAKIKEWIIRELPRWIEEQPALRQQLVDALGSTPPPPRMTYEEFLQWADEDTLAEWINGEVVMTSPADDRHQDITDFLVSITRPFVELRGLGIVRTAPFQMKLAQSGREPDLLFVAKGHLDRLKGTYLDGPADLVVEIVSPESVARDRGAKFQEYETAAIPEYWLIDPTREWAEFYRLDARGRYVLAFGGEEGVFHSQVIPGFWLRVEWLWQEPLPPTIRTVAQIAGVDAALIEAFERALGKA